MAGRFTGGQTRHDGKRTLSKVPIDVDVSDRLLTIVERTGASANFHVNEALKSYTAAKIAQLDAAAAVPAGRRG